MYFFILKLHFMKRSFLLFVLAVLTLGGSRALAQFDVGLIVEDEDASGTCLDLVPVFPAHANAYGSLDIQGVLSDLYVYTWDCGSNSNPNYGFAVRSYKTGVPVHSGTFYIAEDYRSFTGEGINNSKQSPAVGG
jgi:hypothetical protein